MEAPRVYATACTSQLLCWVAPFDRGCDVTGYALQRRCVSPAAAAAAAAGTSAVVKSRHRRRVASKMVDSAPRVKAQRRVATRAPGAGRVKRHGRRSSASAPGSDSDDGVTESGSSSDEDDDTLSANADDECSTEDAVMAAAGRRSGPSAAATDWEPLGLRRLADCMVSLDPLREVGAVKVLFHDTFATHFHRSTGLRRGATYQVRPALLWFCSAAVRVRELQ